MRIAALVILVISLMGSPALADTVTVNVPGHSDPWLAGMPNGSGASGGDIAPDQSPVLVSGVFPGLILTFSASGLVSYGPGFPLAGPDGSLPFFSHTAGVENGISDIITTINSLVGVFLDNNQPDLSPAPAALDFSTLGLNFTSLAPLLQQVFFIGDGVTDLAEVQQFSAPAGATRLFLGTMDGSGWFNNLGSFDVTVTGPVPVPGSLVLLGSGLLGLAGWRRFRKS